MFQKRHYEFLARFLGREIEVSFEKERKLIIAGLARLLASELERDNPRFNRDKFLSAAGVDE